MDFQVGSVVYHAKAVFGPGTVTHIREDVDLGRLYRVLWQSTGQVLDHTATSLSRSPVEPAGSIR